MIIVDIVRFRFIGGDIFKKLIIRQSEELSMEVTTSAFLRHLLHEMNERGLKTS